jgi:hypothetical protein
MRIPRFLAKTISVGVVEGEPIVLGSPVHVAVGDYGTTVTTRRSILRIKALCQNRFDYRRRYDKSKGVNSVSATEGCSRF